MFFEKGFKKSFLSLNEKLKDDGLLVVFFAHSTNEAWNILLESIALGKFQVKSSFSLHTENSQKYQVDEFRELARGAGFNPCEVWTDEYELFSVHLLRV